MKPKYLLAFLNKRIRDHDFYLENSTIFCRNCDLQVMITELQQSKSRKYSAFAVTDTQARRYVIAVQPKAKLSNNLIVDFQKAYQSCKTWMIGSIIET